MSRWSSSCTVAFLALLVGCNGESGTATSVVASSAVTPGQRGFGPDGQFFAPPTAAGNRSLATRWPLVLSHCWSRPTRTAFLGDQLDATGNFDAYGVKTALEAGGAVVYQPDKLAYASHEKRGQLLYKKCAGTTVDELLCKGDNPKVVDGMHWATLDYCSKPEWRERSGFADEASCQRGLQFNIICHSQGCPDSRYLLAVVHNEFSGELMYKHVASWTSLAGANKGTAQADWIQEKLLACLTPQCKSLVLDAAFAVDSFQKNEALITDGGESVVALTRKYMLQTTDMECTPGQGKVCAPSFNQRYPLPEDPSHPVLYQTFSSQINDINHPCFLSDTRLWWEIVQAHEGANDGNISVESQQFTTYGPGAMGGSTPIIPRWVMGGTTDPALIHPGLPHMAYSSAKVPGMQGVSCLGEDNSAYHFSRVGLFRDIVAELAERGY